MTAGAGGSDPRSRGGEPPPGSNRRGGQPGQSAPGFGRPGSQGLHALPGQALSGLAAVGHRSGPGPGLGPRGAGSLFRLPERPGFPGGADPKRSWPAWAWPLRSSPAESTRRCTAPQPRPWSRPGRSPRPCTIPAPASIRPCWPCACIRVGRWPTTWTRSTRCRSSSWGRVARRVGLPPGQIPVALDGCGAPVFYVPLKNIALGFARLAAAQKGSHAAVLMDACLAHPRHIAGDGRLDTVIMEALPGKVFAKTGGGKRLRPGRQRWRPGRGPQDRRRRQPPPGACHRANPGSVGPPKRPGPPKALAAQRQGIILNHRQQQVGLIKPVLSW